MRPHRNFSVTHHRGDDDKVIASHDLDDGHAGVDAEADEQQGERVEPARDPDDHGRVALLGPLGVDRLGRRRLA